MDKILNLTMILLLLIVIPGESKPRELWITFFSEAITFPSFRLFRIPIHPGISFGMAILTKQKNNHEHTFTIECGYFYAELTGHTFILFPEYRWELIIRKVVMGTDIGLGYKHNIFARPVYKRIDRQYKKIIDWGSPQLMLPIGLKIGYIFSHEIKVYIQYRSIGAFPFNLKGGLPIIPHTTFHIGVSFPVFFKNHKQDENHVL
jgi:hypothetical protein